MRPTLRFGFVLRTKLPYENAPRFLRCISLTRTRHSHEDEKRNAAELPRLVTLCVIHQKQQTQYGKHDYDNREASFHSLTTVAPFNVSVICIKMIHTLPTEYKDDYQNTGRHKHDGQKVFQSAYEFIIPHPPSPYMTVKQESQRRES